MGAIKFMNDTTIDETYDFKPVFYRYDAPTTSKARYIKEEQPSTSKARYMKEEQYDEDGYMF